GAQIQNRGTLGGNIANASPAADAVPVLAAAEATLVLVGDKERRVPITEFFPAYRRTALAPDELIASVEIPRTEGAWFRKGGTRGTKAISKVVMSASRGERRRIALGSVAPRVVRLPLTEAVLASGASLE